MCLLVGTPGIDRIGADPTALALLAAAPWLAVLLRRAPAADAFNREWLAFRDRFGMVWALPARDELTERPPTTNGASSSIGRDSAGRKLRDVCAGEAAAGLHAVLKRFGPEEDHPA